MKKRTFALGLMVLTIALGGCQKIKDAFTVKLDADFTVTLPVTTTAPILKSSTAEFLSTSTLDPLDDEDLALYKEKIKGFEVTGITGRISELSSDVNLTNVKLLVNTELNTTEWTFANLPISNGTVVIFDNTGGQWTKIDKILMEQKPVTVTLSGNADQPDVTFNIEVKFQTVVTTKAL